MTEQSRIEQYLRTDGTWSTSRKDAILATPDAVVQAVRRYGTPIAEQYFLGTAKHETNWATNERDMEHPDTRGVRFTSWGIYQISMEEARAVGRPSAQLLVLSEVTNVMVQLAERRRLAIRAQLGLDWPGYKARNPTIRIVSSGYGDDTIPTVHT